MKPYYERDGITLYHADCRDGLGSLDVSDISLICTDPPYGIGINKSHRLSTSRGFAGETWDDQPCDPAVLKWVLDTGKPAIVWGGNYFDLPPAKCFLIWDKQNDGRDFADCEQAWTNIDAVARIHRQRPMNMDGGKVHPTQKPIRLMEWCIEKAGLNPGSLVVDLFAGSGTTGIAAWRLGMRCVLFEKHRPHADSSAKRIDDEITKGRLFTPAAVVEKQSTMFGEPA